MSSTKGNEMAKKAKTTIVTDGPFPKTVLGLVDELRRLHPACVLVLSNGHETEIHVKGDTIHALGMVAYADEALRARAVGRSFEEPRP